MSTHTATWQHPITGEAFTVWLGGTITASDDIGNTKVRVWYRVGMDDCYIETSSTDLWSLHNSHGIDLKHTTMHDSLLAFLIDHYNNSLH